MKRIGVLVCLILMVVSVLVPASFAANENNSQNTGFAIESSIPHNNDDGVSVENLSVKIYFNKDVMPASNKIKKANAKEFKLTDKKGKSIPVNVYYSDKEEGLLMVVSDLNNKKAKEKNITIQGDMNYTLTIGKDLQATDGSRLGHEETIKFKTLNQQQSTRVYMILMAVMIVGMIVFTTKSAKKAAEKEDQNAGKSKTVNPYKEAKRTGKSVEEIVAKDKQRKAKEAEAYAKKKAKEAEIIASLEDDEEEEEISSNKRVSGPRPISAAGSSYKVKVVKSQPEKKVSTNPKNQSGKKKNSKNKKK